MKRILFLIVACLLVVPGLALASPEADCKVAGGTWLTVPIFGADKQCIHDPAEYVSEGYKLAIGLVGIVAVVMIMIGGYQYLTSAGNASTMSDAKDRITQAILGLVLALLSYLILYVLNPDLVNLKWNSELLGGAVQQAQEDITTRAERESCDATQVSNNKITVGGVAITTSGLAEGKPKVGVWLEVKEDSIGSGNYKTTSLDSEKTVEQIISLPGYSSGDVGYFKIVSNEVGVCDYIDVEQIISGNECPSSGDCGTGTLCLNEPCTINSSNGTCRWSDEVNIEDVPPLECKP